MYFSSDEFEGAELRDCCNIDILHLLFSNLSTACYALTLRPNWISFFKIIKKVAQLLDREFLQAAAADPKFATVLKFYIYINWHPQENPDDRICIWHLIHIGTYILNTKWLVRLIPSNMNCYYKIYSMILYFWCYSSVRV